MELFYIDNPCFFLMTKYNNSEITDFEVFWTIIGRKMVTTQI